MDLGLTGKTAIVTGGGSNIGRAISLAFAGEGANVVIAEIDEAQGQKVVKEINALGARAIVVKMDVTNYAQVEQMVKRTLDEFNRIDVLVNNVGWDDLMLFTETTPELWDKIISINYKGVLNCIKLVLPHFIEQKSGAIVNIGSDAGRIGEFREAVYGGCKGAVIAMSKAVAREVGRYGIRLNVVCPGVTTPTSSEEFGEASMWQEGLKVYTPEVLEKVAKGMPLRKIGKATDLASAVVFLASDVAAGHITGQTLSVSGGYSMM